VDLQNSFTAAKSSKFPTKPVLGYPPHLKYVAVTCCITLENLKIRNLQILIHVKHVSNVTFHHLSNRWLPNIMKINVKINSMQKNQHFVFFCLFTVLKILKECLIAVWSNFRQVIIDTALDQWRKRLQACVRANGGHFEHLLWSNPCNLHFYVFLVQVASIHRVSFFAVLMLDGR